MATVDTYDETGPAGALDLTFADVADGSDQFRFLDIWGQVVASGEMSGDSVTVPAPEGGWPPGWMYCTFVGPWRADTGYIHDTVMVSVLRDDVAPVPMPPPVGTPTDGADPNDRGIDTWLHSFGTGGPNRWQIGSAANPTVNPPNIPSVGGTIAAIAANLAQEQEAGGYLDPDAQDPARSHDEFVQFPNDHHSVSGYAAGVTSVVDALGPGTPSDVRYFEGYNEPHGQFGLSPAQTAEQYEVFRAAVAAGHPDALAMGPCEVTYAPVGNLGADGLYPFGPPVSILAEVLAALPPLALQAFSYHLYNGYNGDWDAIDGWIGAVVGVLDDAGYPADLPKFLTETDVGDNWSLWDPRRQLQWVSQLYITAERWGIPTEHIYWFYDEYVAGFQATWLKEATGDLRPHAVFLRVFREEVWGKDYESPLDFGALAGRFFRGNLYRGEDGACVALMAQGLPAGDVTLAVSDVGPLSVVDFNGQVTTVPVVAGHATIMVSDLPLYVRLSADCTVTVVDAGNGLISGTPVNVAPDATVSSFSEAPNVDRVNNGVFETGGYLPAPDEVFWSVGLPDSLTLTWDDEQTVKKVLIRQIAPFANNHATAMVEGRLEFWNGSGWLPCPTVAENHWDSRGRYVNETAASFLSRVGNGRRAVSFYDNNWQHNVDLAVPVVTTALRWTVTRSGYGHVPDRFAALYAPFGFIGLPGVEQRIMCSEIVVLSDDEAPTPGFGAFA